MKSSYRLRMLVSLTAVGAVCLGLFQNCAGGLPASVNEDGSLSSNSSIPTEVQTNGQSCYYDGEMFAAGARSSSVTVSNVACTYAGSIRRSVSTPMVCDGATGTMKVAGAATTTDTDNNCVNTNSPCVGKADGFKYWVDRDSALQTCSRGIYYDDAHPLLKVGNANPSVQTQVGYTVQEELVCAGQVPRSQSPVVRRNNYTAGQRCTLATECAPMNTTGYMIMYDGTLAQTSDTYWIPVSGALNSTKNFTFSNYSYPFKCVNFPGLSTPVWALDGPALAQQWNLFNFNFNGFW